MTDFDVVIVGAGLVGLATACSLANNAMNIAIIDGKSNIYQKMNNDDISIRASAINLASKYYFEQIGIWDQLESSAESYHLIRLMYSKNKDLLGYKRIAIIINTQI